MDDKTLSCVSGYHIYYILFGICAQEKCSVVKGNRHNLNERLTAVSVKKYDVTVGYIRTWKIFRM